MENDLGQSITYSGNNYKAVVSIPFESRQYDDDTSGYFISRMIEVSVRVNLIGNTIAVGEKIIYDTDTYRIVERTQDSTRGLIKLRCEGESL